MISNVTSSVDFVNDSACVFDKLFFMRSLDPLRQDVREEACTLVRMTRVSAIAALTTPKHVPSGLKHCHHTGDFQGCEFDMERPGTLAVRQDAIIACLGFGTSFHLAEDILMGGSSRPCVGLLVYVAWRDAVQGLLPFER